MKNGRGIYRGICLLLAAVLLLIFCSAGHECHSDAMDHHCPVCLILSAWKLALPGLLALTGVACFAGAALHTGDAASAHSGEKTTLVALKVKLSD